MKKALCGLLAALLLCLPLCACTNFPLARSQPVPKTIKIGVSVYDQNDTFVRVITDNLQRMAREREVRDDVTISILYSNADNNQVAQNSQVDSFIRDGCDIICVNLVDRTDASAIIDKAKAADIPVLFFNRELVEEDLERWDKLYYVGAMALESGRMQGEIVASLCAKNFEAVDRNGDGVLQYVMLEGQKGHQDAIVRTEYSINTMMEAGYKLERLEDEIANWSAAQAETKMTHFLAQHGENIEVVFCNNDEMALGAIQALHTAVAKGEISEKAWPIVVGIDGTPGGVQAVRNGDMHGTVFNDGPGQAKALLELSFMLVRGAPLPADIALIDGKYVRLPYRKITPENSGQYLAAS